jgi:LmbE family N-acetylglucosaminyl deacetylase
VLSWRGAGPVASRTQNEGCLDVPFYFVGRRRDEITTVVDVSDPVGAKLRGIRCHATQVGRDGPFSETPDEVMQQPWFRSKTFVLARSTVGWPEGVETDLFAGLTGKRNPLTS